MSKATVLILGGTSDLGKALARRYAEAGYNLIIAGRNTEELDKNAKDIEIRHSVSVDSVYFDVLDLASHQAFFDQFTEKPSGVISVIGYLGDQEKGASNQDHAQLILNSNYAGLVSIFSIIAESYKGLRSGFLVGVSSVAGDRGRKSNYLYGSAKAGFTAYLSGLRNAMFEHNVHVLTVKPGFINTSMTVGMDLPAALTKQPDEVADDIFKAQQKGRNTCYSGWYWQFIMLIIRHIPEFIFKRLSL